MKAEDLARVSEGRQALADGEVAKEQQSADQELDELKDPEKQEKIDNPDPTIFNFKYKGQDKQLKLYPMPSKMQRKFVGFSSKVYADARGKYNDGTSQYLRIMGVLTEDYLDDFLQYVAWSLFEHVDKVEPQQLSAMIRELDEQLGSQDFPGLFMQVGEVNDVAGKLFGGG